jgi:hypothetical protein
MVKSKRSKRKKKAQESQSHDMAAATVGNNDEDCVVSERTGEKRKHIVPESCDVSSSADKQPRQGMFQKMRFSSHASKPNSLFSLQRVTVNMMCQIEAFQKAKSHSELL